MKKIKEIIQELKDWAHKSPLTLIFVGFFFLFIATIFQDEIKQTIKGSGEIVINFSKGTEVIKKKDSIKADSVKPILIKNIFTTNWKETGHMNTLCKELRNEYGCDYVNVNALHNGTQSNGGWHFSKMSCIAESLGEGVPSQAGRLKDWSTDLFSGIMYECNRDKVKYVPDFTKYEVPYLAHRIPKFGIYSVVYAAVLDNRYIDEEGNYKMVGFISFGWTKPTDSTHVTTSDIEAMKSDAARFKKFLIKN